VNFSGLRPDGVPRGIYGCFAQIWISPNGDGQYTQTTPGFRTENNSTLHEFNLDSHFLGNPANYIVNSPLEEGNVDFPGFNPIPSNETFGYGSGRPFNLVHQVALTGYMRGAFDIVAAQQSSTFDVAYVALGGGGFLFGQVFTTQGTFEFDTGFSTGPSFPEPRMMCWAGGLLLLLRRTSARISLAESRGKSVWTRSLQRLQHPHAPRANGFGAVGR
jgi:hypothetical protein